MRYYSYELRANDFDSSRFKARAAVCRVTAML